MSDVREDPPAASGGILRFFGGAKDAGTKELEQKESSSPDAPDSARIVSARGTEDGLVLRIDGRASWEDILGEMRLFLGTRRRFLEGGAVSIEWLDRLPTKEQSSELEEFLKSECGIGVMSRRKRPAFTTITTDSKGEPKPATEIRSRPQAKSAGEPAEGERRARYDSPSYAQRGAESAPSGDAIELGGESELREREMRALGDDDLAELELGGKMSQPGYLRRMAKLLGDDIPYEEDANAKIVFGTFRSGQRIETPFSLIVVGDVNPGADLIAGGDIIIFGGLRGTAHASAYDDEAQDRIIVALTMQPMQLRIGSVISRGNDDIGKGAEIARIENRRIVVEAFQPRVLANRRVKF